jgi:hypothetical protein
MEYNTRWRGRQQGRREQQHIEQGISNVKGLGWRSKIYSRLFLGKRTNYLECSIFKGGTTAHVGVPANVINVDVIRIYFHNGIYNTRWRGRQQGR